MSIRPRKLGAVTRSEALSLLAGISLGRIVFTENAMPAVRPASHIVESGVIVARSHDGSSAIPGGGKPRSAAGPDRATVVAYQAETIDISSRLGWSVVVTGPATPVVDPAEIARYSAVLGPWTDAGEGQLICIQPGIVTGYRLLEGLP